MDSVSLRARKFISPSGGAHVLDQWRDKNQPLREFPPRTTRPNFMSKILPIPSSRHKRKTHRFLGPKHFAHLPKKNHKSWNLFFCEGLPFAGEFLPRPDRLHGFWLLKVSIGKSQRFRTASLPYAVHQAQQRRKAQSKPDRASNSVTYCLGEWQKHLFWSYIGASKTALIINSNPFPKILTFFKCENLRGLRADLNFM